MAYARQPGGNLSAHTAALQSIRQRQGAKAAQVLIGICAGIAADGVLHEREVHFLATWLAENPEVTGEWPGSELGRRVREILADGIITDGERTDLLETLQQLSGNYFADTGATQPEGPALPVDDDPCIIFGNRSFCFTGRFLYGTRAACERAILRLGGMAVDSVSRRLDYLVIGTMIEPQWINTTYGRKIEKAVGCQQAGAELAIVSERQWTAALADTGMPA